MEKRFLNIFLGMCAVILIVTGLAKVISALGTDEVLTTFDPITGLRFKTLFSIVGGIEFCFGSICLLSRRLAVLEVILIAWLSTSFVVYRIGLAIVGYTLPCPCLGSFTGALHISAEAADTAMKIVLAYLLIGSYGALIWLWRQGHRSFIPPSTPAATTVG